MPENAVEKKEVKPGFKTSEFWMAAAAEVAGLVLASGCVVPGSKWAQIVGMVVAGLAAMGYSASRARTKASVK